MNSREPKQVDQALFGYSDGHRQIAASIRLPSRDQYQLAAATDLATGARLGPEDSYLTGLPLAESRCFALIRTWLAPEMPRPGCVWSHVILINFPLLSSHGDLSDFLGLLKRPDDLDPNFYGEPLSVDSSARFGTAPDLDSMIRLIRTYYSGEPVLLRPTVAPGSLEAAIIAVWSQQWPRLRISFSFRTTAGSERRRSELINYDVQVGSSRDTIFPDEDAANSGNRSWVAAAAADAATSCVTPLRRFLWRYGRDLLSPRKHFRALVQLYLATEGKNELAPEQATQIFDSLPEAGDGEILKRDILGIDSVSPPLCRPLSFTGLLQLLATSDPGSLPGEAEIGKRFDAIPAEQVGDIAMYVDRHRLALSRWENVINAGLAASADRNALVGKLPERLRKLILMSRSDLIDPDTVAVLPNDSLLELALLPNGNEVSRKLAFAIVRRDFGSSNGQLLRSMPSIIFEACVEATRCNELNSVWMQVIAENNNAILATNWPAGVRSTSELAIELSLLRFPRNDGRLPEVWANALEFMQDDASGEDRVRVQAFLLSVALQNMAPASWKLVRAVLPELRPVILRGKLPEDAYQMLVNALPKLRSTRYWDFDRPILVALSRLNRNFPDDEGALHALDLSRDDLNAVVEAEAEDERSKSRFWRWF